MNLNRSNTSPLLNKKSLDYEVLPGDQLIALKAMRAWVSADIRGTEGNTITVGTMVLVISVWFVDVHRRLLVIHEDKLCIFSCRVSNTYLNWAKTSHELFKDWDGLVLERGIEGALRTIERFQTRSQLVIDDSSELKSGPSTIAPVKT